WAVFILSAGLSRTGVAAWLGRQVLRMGGGGEMRMMLVIMAASAVLSGFMNNVGVTALMLPVVLDISRRTNRPPSRMLMPLAFSTLLGGMVTLIGTPSNILVADILSESGLVPFTLFNFAPFGFVVAAAGILYLLTLGRVLLPTRNVAKEFKEHEHDMSEEFAIEERLFVISLPEETKLHGRTLGQSRLGSVLGMNVIGVMRKGHTNLSPDPHTELQGDDKLLVTGRSDRLKAWNETPQFKILSHHLLPEYLTSDEIKLMEFSLEPGSPMLGKNLEQLHFRQRYGGIVVAIWRDEQPIYYQMESIILQPQDKLLMMVSHRQARFLKSGSDLALHETDASEYNLERALYLIKIPSGSHFVGRTIADSHLGDAYRMGVYGILREGKTNLMPVANEILYGGDMLLVKTRPESINTLESLHAIKVEKDIHLHYADIESDQVGLMEVVISPQSSLPGKTLRETHFREKYGLSVLAIWRGGTTRRSGLRDVSLRFGDALLVFGPRDKLNLLGTEPDFLPLTEAAQPAPLLKKAPLAAALMVGVVLLVGLGLLPIAIAAILGGALMVLSGCLGMREAYRAIEWKAIFLIAGMLPLGIAMQTSGTAEFLASEVVAFLAPYGTRALIGGLFMLTVLASQVMPNPVVTVLMAPVALSTASSLGLSPYTFAMAIAIGASSSFLSPVGHPSNILIMGPGGYKFSDYIKVGVPLVLITLALTLFVLPLFWPL
ncbi:MAG TPA: SLC13 family permease, partial [Anaerolineales bacterium]|nr:SLC13 family permease [Anaerolineales bacterium]